MKKRTCAANRLKLRNLPIYFAPLWAKKDMANVIADTIRRTARDFKDFDRENFFLSFFLFVKFIIIGKKIDKNVKITEVRNPKKIDKLEHIAKKYNLDPEIFKAESEKLKKKRFFLD